MILPICLNHDYKNPIGKATAADGKLEVEFRRDAGVTLNMALTAFNGLRVIESELIGDREVVLKAEVFAFSVEY